MNMKKQPKFHSNCFSSNNWRTYEHAIKRIRCGLSKGLTYEQACNTLTDIDQDMKIFIVEDFLKILIAEEHFGSGLGIDDMALLLGLPYEKIVACRSAMIEEVDHEIKNQHISSTQCVTQ